VVLLIKTTASNGKKITVGGNPTKWDGMPVKRRSERTVECTLTKAGAIVDSGTAVVSIDGKTLTLY
jgi:uncharacterized Zn-binding protein involved in type VI secretion